MKYKYKRLKDETFIVHKIKEYFRGTEKECYDICNQLNGRIFYIPFWIMKSFNKKLVDSAMAKSVYDEMQWPKKILENPHGDLIVFNKIPTIRQTGGFELMEDPR